MIWSVPPRALAGSITVTKTGEISYDGTFWTPSHPDGVEAKDLNHKEKDNLLTILHQNMDRWTNARWKEPPEIYYLKSGSHNALSSTLPVMLRVTVPSSIVIGSNILLTATAVLPWGTVLQSAHYDWYLSDGRILTGKNVQVTFKEPGTHKVTVKVTDLVGTYQEEIRQITVKPANTQNKVNQH